MMTWLDTDFQPQLTDQQNEDEALYRSISEDELFDVHELALMKNSGAFHLNKSRSQSKRRPVIPSVKVKLKLKLKMGKGRQAKSQVMSWLTKKRNSGKFSCDLHAAQQEHRCHETFTNGIFLSSLKSTDDVTLMFNV